MIEGRKPFVGVGITALAQTFSGIKTWLSAMILSAGLVINGALAASPNYIATFGSTFIGSFATGDSQFKFGHGNNSSVPVPTISILNTTASFGKALAIYAGTTSCGMSLDDASTSWRVIKAPRANLDAGGSVGTDLLSINVATGNATFLGGVIATSGSFTTLQASQLLTAQAGMTLTGNQPADANTLAQWSAPGPLLSGTPSGSKFRWHHGNGSTYSMFDVTNTTNDGGFLGRYFGVGVGLINTRVFISDDTGSFTFTRLPRAECDSGTPATFTSLLSITVATGNVTVGQGQLNTSNRNTWTAPQCGTVNAITSSAGSIAINLATRQFMSHTTTENTTLAAPTNAAVGQAIVMNITQGGTARTMAFNAAWKFPGGTVPTLTAIPGAVDMLIGFVESASPVRVNCQLLKGFA